MPEEQQTRDDMKQEQDPYDYSNEEKELAQLQDELKQAQESIDKNFADYASARLEESPELEEMFFNDKTEFISAILSMQQQFLEQEIGEKHNRASELSSSIQSKKANSEYLKAKNEFMQEYPDENPDELLEYAKDNLAPKQLEELGNLPPLEFLKAVKGIKDKQAGGGEGKELPKNIEGQAGDALQGSAGINKRNSVFSRA